MRLGVRGLELQPHIFFDGGTCDILAYGEESLPPAAYQAVRGQHDVLGRGYVSKLPSVSAPRVAAAHSTWEGGDLQVGPGGLTLLHPREATHG